MEAREDGDVDPSVSQHGIPRVAATTLDKSEQARHKERKQITQYQALEKDVVDRVGMSTRTNLFTMLRWMRRSKPKTTPMPPSSSRRSSLRRTRNTTQSGTTGV